MVDICINKVHDNVNLTEVFSLLRRRDQYKRSKKYIEKKYKLRCSIGIQNIADRQSFTGARLERETVQKFTRMNDETQRDMQVSGWGETPIEVDRQRSGDMYNTKVRMFQGKLLFQCTSRVIICAGFCLFRGCYFSQSKIVIRGRGRSSVSSVSKSSLRVQFKIFERLIGYKLSIEIGVCIVVVLGVDRGLYRIVKEGKP
jgi:hypothetical protein